MVAGTTTLMTADELWELPSKDHRYELVRGELRTRAPAGFEHGNIGSGLLVSLRQHVNSRGLGRVVGAATGFVLSRDPDVVRSPDVAFVARARVPVEPVVKFFPGAPDLAVEVLSPTDTFDEIEEKIEDYFSAGTRLVWVVNPRSKSVSVYRPAVAFEVLRGDQKLTGLDVVEGFECRVADLFA